MSLFAWILVLALFSVYGWLGTIEGGVSLMRAFPNLVASSQRASRLFTPLWEITNVFLVFGFTGFAVLFNNALVPVAHTVLSTLIVGLFALLIRSFLVLYLFYFRPDSRGLMSYLFVLSSFAVPSSFGAVGIYLLTGQLFWQTAAGWALFVTMALGWLSLAVSFVAFLGGKTAPARLRAASRWFNVVFALLAAVGLQMALRHSQSRLLQLPYAYFAVLVSFAVLLQALLMWARREWQTWLYMSFLALVGPLLLGLANRPYLLYPSFTLQSAFGAQAYGPVIIIGLIAIFPLMLLGLALFAWLLISNKN